MDGRENMWLRLLSCSQYVNRRGETPLHLFRYPACSFVIRNVPKLFNRGAQHPGILQEWAGAGSATLSELQRLRVFAVAERSLAWSFLDRDLVMRPRYIPKYYLSLAGEI